MVVAIGFALLFHRMAAYERMTAWVWAVASIGVSLLAMWFWSGFAPLILLQVGLFAVLWWYNLRRVGRREQEWAAKREKERRLRDERMRRAQEEIRREREERERREH